MSPIPLPDSAIFIEAVELLVWIANGKNNTTVDYRLVPILKSLLIHLGQVHIQTTE